MWQRNRISNNRLWNFSEQLKNVLQRTEQETQPSTIRNNGTLEKKVQLCMANLEENLTRIDESNISKMLIHYNHKDRLVCAILNNIHEADLDQTVRMT